MAYSDRGDGGIDTSIARLWRAGDVMRCGLCPIGQCTVSAFGLCQIVVHKRIPGPDCWLYAIRDGEIEGSALADDPRVDAGAVVSLGVRRPEAADDALLRGSG